jgi:hypothetical protein
MSSFFKAKELPFKITILSTDQKFWNEKKFIEITNRKLAPHVYIDDRSFRFEGHFKGMIEQSEAFNICKTINFVNYFLVQVF